MERMGLLEVMARSDLAVLHEEVARAYTPGALEALAQADPGWRAELDRAEREAWELFEALREADATLLRWRRGMAELARLWLRVAEAPLPGGAVPLEEVA